MVARKEEREGLRMPNESTLDFKFSFSEAGFEGNELVVLG